MGAEEEESEEQVRKPSTLPVDKQRVCSLWFWSTARSATDEAPKVAMLSFCLSVCIGGAGKYSRVFCVK